jgi:DNA-binding GntR family transcriptional regulator
VTVEELERLNQLSEANYRPGDRGSAEQFLRANADFHNTVARASGNEMMAEMISTLLERTERLNHLAHMLGDRNEAAYHEHHELVAALAAGDGAGAGRIMAEQIVDSRDFVISALLASPSLQAVNVTGPAPDPSLVAR